ncbi:MAG TPA: mechanosensitive ion channel family protein [Pseudolabrys sp.]|nr:mechanosensitive ion channel family protein [Pseudolabrys sp.]
MDSIRSGLSAIRNLLDWLPDDLVGGLILLLSIIVALALHKIGRGVVRRSLASRHPYVLSVFTQTREISRLALVVFAMLIALPAAPFDPAIAYWFARFLLIAIIGLAGWAIVAALSIAANLYLLRYRLDVEDNLLARKHNTQIRVLLRSIDVLIVLFTIGAALMTFEPVRQYGVSLFASAGVAGIIAGLAARPVLSNLFAGVQLAMTQPIRIADAVIVENEWGTIEEITSTYVVVQLWDLRRMIVPLTYFIEKPFQNWTRDSSALLGTILLYLDYSAPIGAIRQKLQEIVKQSKTWNGKTAVVQVTDANDRSIELRILVSANNAGATFDLRCEVREKLIDFLQREHPYALPRQRNETVVIPAAKAADADLLLEPNRQVRDRRA